MSPRKLTDTNRNEILKLYRDTTETTSTLAERYGVSSSTISRFLKSRLSESEYEELIQKKRLSRTPSRDADLLEASGEDELHESEKVKLKPKQESMLAEEKIAEEKTIEEKPAISPRRRRRRSSVVEEEQTNSQTQLKLNFSEEEAEDDEEDSEQGDLTALEEMLGEDLSEDDDDDWEDEDEDDDDDDDVYQPRSNSTEISIFPISEAALPKTCYVVIDRAAELITRPLREFRDLGLIPTEEIQQKTLPVFDNHRVARRFSNRSQRVIKVPDGAMFQKTSSYLQAKGINLLLIDGQVYKV